jgi:hypothetical protein
MRLSWASARKVNNTTARLRCGEIQQTASLTEVSRVAGRQAAEGRSQVQQMIASWAATPLRPGKSSRVRVFGFGYANELTVR